MKSIYLLRGVPGAGKTTIAKHLSGLIGKKSIALSADDWMFGKDGKGTYNPDRLKEVHEECRLAVEKAMNKGIETIFVHNTMTMEWEMERFEDLAGFHGYRVFHIVVENRHGNKSVHNCGEDVYTRFRNRFQIKL